MKANYFLAGVMALSLLASCVKEDVGGVGGPGKEGLETEATVTIKIYGQDGTRAVSTRAEGTDGTDGTDTGSTTTKGIENTLQSIDILQFMGQNDAATLESVTSVDLKDLNGAATEVKQTIRGSEGSKTFVAIANDTTKLIKSKLVTKGDADKDDQGATAATTLGAFKKLLFTAAGEVTKPTFSRNLHIINKDAKNAIESFMMVSDLDTVTLKSMVSSLNNANVNQVSLALTRLTAKVQMTWKGTIEGEGTKFLPSMIDGNALEEGKISFETGKFQIMNVKPDMYPTAVETFPSAAYGDPVLGWNAALLPDTCWIDAATAFNGELATSGYTTENLMFREAPQKKDATCLLVHTKLNIAGGTPTGLPDENPDGIALGDGTFWAIAKFTEDSEKVYRNLESFEGIYTNYGTADTKLKTLAGTGNYSLVEFKGGTVYYRVDLLDWVKGAGKKLQEIASVQRNRFYQVAINNILALGWPKPEEVIDPDDSRPIEDPELNIEATINIAEWVNVSQDVDLQ